MIERKPYYCCKDNSKDSLHIRVGKESGTGVVNNLPGRVRGVNLFSANHLSGVFSGKVSIETGMFCRLLIKLKQVIRTFWEFKGNTFLYIPTLC